jgi:hypothetical protein
MRSANFAQTLVIPLYCKVWHASKVTFRYTIFFIMFVSISKEPNHFLLSSLIASLASIELVWKPDNELGRTEEAILQRDRKTFFFGFLAK